MCSRSRHSFRDWTLLPDDVIYLIVSRINHIEDLMSVSAVCRSWRLVTVKDYSTKRVQLPWMMISPRNILETRGFFSIDRSKYYDIRFSNLQHSRYWGSKFGWLVVLSFNRQFHLFNPVTGNRLDLPPKPIFGGEIDHDDRNNLANSVPGFVRKALLFKDGENEDNYVVVVIGSVSGNLAFARPGEKHWVHIKSPFGRVMSAVWCNGRLIFMLGSGAVIFFEKNDGGFFEAKTFISQTGTDKIWENIGLVEFSGDLLQVTHSYNDLKHWDRTCSFAVYKMDFENKDWVATNDLGDCALFVDADDNAFALKASEVFGCKSNCIYFIEKNWDRYGRYSKSNDVGVFNLKDGKIEPFYIRDPSKSSLLKQNPIWLLPGLC